MATDALEIRMARLEGAYEQINERLAGVEREIAALRSELKNEIGSLRTEIGDVRSELNNGIGSLRSELTGRMQAQFYWLLTFILGSILIPILRDLAAVR